MSHMTSENHMCVVYLFFKDKSSFNLLNFEISLKHVSPFLLTNMKKEKFEGLNPYFDFCKQAHDTHIIYVININESFIVKLN